MVLLQGAAPLTLSLQQTDRQKGVSAWEVAQYHCLRLSASCLLQPEPEVKLLWKAGTETWLCLSCTAVTTQNPQCMIHSKGK